MTAYIAMRRDLRDDARVLQIAASCGIPVEHAIGCLHGVWSIADGLSADGQLAHYTDAMVDAKIGVSGFAAAMRAVDWLRDGRNGLLIPRFSRWFGRSAKKRSQDALRQRRRREKLAKSEGKTAESEDGDRHAHVTRDSHAAVAPVTPLEERRGEEIREEGVKTPPRPAPGENSGSADLRASLGGEGAQGGNADPQRVQVALEDLGVKPPKATALARLGDVTVAEVAEVWRLVEADVHAIDKPSVLVWRLLNRRGLTTKRETLDPELRSVVAALEQARRQHKHNKAAALRLNRSGAA